MRTAAFRRLEGLLADDDWHSQEELSELVSYPDLWVRELAVEHVVEVRREEDTVLIRRSHGHVATAAA